jgi:hypothetical protein
MDPLWESWSQLKVGLKRGMSHSPLYPHFNPTLKLALIPVRGLWIRAQDLTICLHQRVLNAFLQRTRLSWDRKIRLLPHPFPPPHLPSARYLTFSVFLCIAAWAKWLEWETRGWARSRINQRRENVVLYKSFNTLGFASLHSFRFVKEEIQ